MLIRLAHTARRPGLPSYATDSSTRLGYPKIKAARCLARYETAPHTPQAAVAMVKRNRSKIGEVKTATYNAIPSSWARP